MIESESPLRIGGEVPHHDSSIAAGGVIPHAYVVNECSGIAKFR